MSLNVKLPDSNAPKTVAFDEFERGVLYVPASSPTIGTVYTKTLHDTLVWFETGSGRIGVKESTVKSFIPAPQGTVITITQKEDE